MPTADRHESEAIRLASRQQLLDAIEARPGSEVQRNPLSAPGRDDVDSRIVTMKFGGASIATSDALRRVAAIIARANTCERVVAVVSAQQGQTDALMADMMGLVAEPDLAALDVLLATGELQGAAKLAAAICDLGLAAEVVPPWLVLVTDYRFGDAVITRVDTGPILERLARGILPVLPGFLAATADGRMTTLGRGGSDYTAVAIGAALGARRVELCKADTDGIYDRDPKEHASARRFDRLSHDEAVELACAGAKVLQEKAAVLALRHRVPIYVRSTFEVAEKPGTWIGLAADDQETY
jgi:aspartate kinase